MTEKAASNEQQPQPAVKPYWMTVRIKCLVVTLLFLVAACFMYLFLEIPFVETSQWTQALVTPGSGQKAGDEGVIRPDADLNVGLVPSAEKTAMELRALDNMIADFNRKADKSSDIFEQYTGDHDVASFLKWTLGKYFAMSKQFSGIDKEDSEADVKSTITLGRRGEMKKGKSVSTPENFGNFQSKAKEEQKIRPNLKDNKNDDNNLGPKGAEKIATKGSKPRRRLVLFTTWIDKPEKQEAHDNILRTWRLWEPLVMPLLFTNDTNIAEHARSFGWQVLAEPRAGCTGRGVPILREMFRAAMKAFDSHLYAYANGDLLLGNGMLSTVEAIVSNKELMGKPLLGLINRINVDFYNTKREPVYTLKTFDKLAQAGKPMADGSSDGFITNSLFPWQHVPDIVPGRKGVAMWLVSYAREMGVATVDVQETLRAVHMMVTAAGNRESSSAPGSG
ncbi:hypothetical protein PoB_004931100 [Plakobranchus ocellatus]|uniref:Uncharacterized protein n=1 Tax=Plakobranchus ocellatus TaxID=259542 RepID=A0AAV4BQR1_9GAST|nr:hypothetical protein PoB_004931100 [Plakobranchus ocellatus]